MEGKGAWGCGNDASDTLIGIGGARTVLAPRGVPPRIRRQANKLRGCSPTAMLFTRGEWPGARPVVGVSAAADEDAGTIPAVLVVGRLYLQMALSRGQIHCGSELCEVKYCGEQSVAYPASCAKLAVHRSVWGRGVSEN